MLIELSEQNLRQLVALIVKETLAAVQPSKHSTKQLWSEAQTADLLGVSVYALKRWRQDGYVESHSKRRPIVYSAEHVEKIKEFLATR